MIIIGIVGWKNSGKTTLVKNLIKYFTKKKYVVGSIKHAHHNFDIDKRGTDSFIHRKSGASEVLISSNKRFAKIEGRNNLKELSLNKLISKIERSDIVIVEGFKKENHKKIEVIRSYIKNQKPLFESVKNVIAIATNKKVKTNLPMFDINDYQKIGDFIIRNIKK